MKIHGEVQQGSDEWLQLRCGKVTASELHNIMKLDGTLRTGEGPHKYLCAKAAEIYRGRPEFAKGSWTMDQGHFREAEAVPWFEMRYDVDVQRVGFIDADLPLFGCSPDGLIGDHSGLEVKCPEPTAHVRYLLADEVPSEYFLQVHASLLVSGRPQWRFLSYHRDFPKLVLTVERDEKLMSTMAESIATFTAKLTAAVETLHNMEP